MKKLFFAAIIALFAVACAGNQSKATEAEVTAAPDSAMVDETAVVVDSAAAVIDSTAAEVQ